MERLEQEIDSLNTALSPLRSFILPGGSPASAQFHLLRTMARRAERQAWAAAEQYGIEDGSTEASGGLSPLPLKYLNRLSDLFFILARRANLLAGVTDVLWLPGGERNPGRQGTR